MEQAELFDTVSKFPPEFRYMEELISHAQEQQLVHHFQELEFKPFEFHGFLGKRRVVSFGWRYDFSGGGLRRTEDIPLSRAVTQTGGNLRDVEGQRPATRARDGISTRRSDRLAQGPLGLRRRGGHFAGVTLHVPLAQEERCRVAARVRHAGAEIGLPSSRRGAVGLGAQHSGGDGSSILHHLSKFSISVM
jgi:hypothetical protein